MLEVVSPTEQRVRGLIEDFKSTWRHTLEVACQLGEALEAHKQSLPHGEWLPWVEHNFELGERMARNLIDLGANRQEIADLHPDTTVSAAIKWLQQRRAMPRALPEPGSVEVSEEIVTRYLIDVETADVVADIVRVCLSGARTGLDMTYGSGNFWSGEGDIEITAHDADPARAPDGVADFANLPYPDASFDVAFFDPPHMADTGEDSVLGQRFGTYANADLREMIMRGTLEAWRVCRLGIVVKVADTVHGSVFCPETWWVRDALDGRPPYEVVHQVRSRPFVDPKWLKPQLSAINNGSTYMIFKKGKQRHER